MISNMMIKQLFQECIRILEPDKVFGNRNVTQFFRGITSNKWKNNPHPGITCRRNLMVFEKYQVIPKYCFSCYKIYIAPRTVVEMFKLMVVFDNIKLPQNNTRKCQVELRPNIRGLYRGIIYFQSLDEAKDLLDYVTNLVHQEISKQIPVTIQRGCLEFTEEYPEYKVSEISDVPKMTYKQEWKEIESFVDKNLISDIEPIKEDTYDPPNYGYSVRDAQAMRTWLAYASTVGDKSYKKISKSNFWKFPMQEEIGGK